jgi:hypothetical protein
MDHLYSGIKLDISKTHKYTVKLSSHKLALGKNIRGNETNKMVPNGASTSQEDYISKLSFK